MRFTRYDRHQTGTTPLAERLPIHLNLPPGGLIQDTLNFAQNQYPIYAIFRDALNQQQTSFRHEIIRNSLAAVDRRQCC